MLRGKKLASRMNGTSNFKWVIEFNNWNTKMNVHMWICTEKNLIIVAPVAISLFWKLYISTFYWPRFTFLPHFTKLHPLFAVIENWTSALVLGLDLPSYLISQKSISNPLHTYIRAEIVQPKWYQASHPSPLLSHWSRLSFFPFVKGSFPLYRCPGRLAPPGMRVTTNIFSQRLLPSVFD